MAARPPYGRQEGAVVGYNPKKPGRPSHKYLSKSLPAALRLLAVLTVYCLRRRALLENFCSSTYVHTYQMAGLRLVLGVNVQAGNQIHAKTSLPGLLELIDRLPVEKRPRCVRGDCDFGNDGTMRALTDRGVPYLFKLKLTKTVKRYLAGIFWRDDWENAGQGWEGRAGEIKLHGWQASRRIIALRRPLTGDVVLADESRQLDLAFVECDRPAKRYEYAAPTTDLPHEIGALAQLYRDRADSENAFDELKNQWGWGGYTTTAVWRHVCQHITTVITGFNWLAPPQTPLLPSPQTG